MNQEDALNTIKKALNSTQAEYSDESIKLDTNLIDEGILDSLDAMSFLFELETIIDKKITEIDEEFEDFNVGKFVEILRNY
tara:strand:+ start:3179 stop:3421 length:243 start_codon:yes stop_codon:yes gene_type:complete